MRLQINEFNRRAEIAHEFACVRRVRRRSHGVLHSCNEAEEIPMTSDLGVFIAGGKTGILLLHDLGGSAAELRPLAHAIARAGYSVSCPQLGSHLAASPATGPNGPGLWLSEAEQALSRLKSRCEGVVVLGCAYGSMLGVELARQNAGAVHALILVEPRAWLPSIPGRIASALAGRMPQVWLARLTSLARGILVRRRPEPDATIGATVPAHRLINEIALLLDSSHRALSSVKQPVLLVHRHAAKRAGLDSSILLQRQLGGRVESISVDESGHAGASERLTDGIAERSQRFVATVFEDIETRRGNELRRQRVSTRSDAA